MSSQSGTRFGALLLDVWIPTVLDMIPRIEQLRPFRTNPPALQLYGLGVNTVPIQGEVSLDPWCPVCTATVLVPLSGEVSVVMLLDMWKLGLC